MIVIVSGSLPASSISSCLCAPSLMALVKVLHSHLQESTFQIALPKITKVSSSHSFGLSTWDLKCLVT